jgi:hypothetical protein
MRYGVLLLGLAAVGCAPAIYTFTATPNESCPGAPVTLAWNASKEGGQISSQPAGFSYPTTVSKGSTPTTTPQVTTRYHFEVKNLWGSAARDADVTVPVGSLVPIGGSVTDDNAPTCVEGKLSLTAKAPPDMWQSQLRVAQIATLEGDAHTYHVEHGGKQADLTPGGAPGNSSDALAGTVVGGDWKLSVTLIGAERCPTPGAPLTVPRNLGVRLTTACTPKK